MHNYARTTCGYAPSVGLTTFTPSYTATTINSSLGKRMWSGWPVFAATLTFIMSLCILPATFIFLGTPLQQSSLTSAIITTIYAIVVVFLPTVCVYFKCKKMVNKNWELSNQLETQPTADLQGSSNVRGQNETENEGIDERATMCQNGILYDPPSYDTAVIPTSIPSQSTPTCSLPQHADSTNVRIHKAGNNEDTSQLSNSANTLSENMRLITKVDNSDRGNESSEDCREEKPPAYSTIQNERSEVCSRQTRNSECMTINNNRTERAILPPPYSETSDI